MAIRYQRRYSTRGKQVSEKEVEKKRAVSNCKKRTGNREGDSMVKEGNPDGWRVY